MAKKIKFEKRLTLNCSFETAMKILVKNRVQLNVTHEWSEPMEISLSGASDLIVSFTKSNFEFVIIDKKEDHLRFSSRVETELINPVRVLLIKQSQSQFNQATISFRMLDSDSSRVSVEIR